MSAYSDLILSETALASYWRLGETAGSTTVADSKGSITGTVIAVVTLGTTGLLVDDSDTCADISTGRITCGDNYDFTGTANFTAEAWINPDAAALTANALILSKFDSIEGWYLRILAAGGIRAIRMTGGVQDTSESTTGLIVAGTTYHLACTYDGTDLRVFRNGAQVATVGSTRSLNGHTEILGIGARGAGGNQYDGRIDEAAIYNDDLTADQLLSHYNVGIGIIPFVPKIVVVGQT